METEQEKGALLRQELFKRAWGQVKEALLEMGMTRAAMEERYEVRRKEIRERDGMQGEKFSFKAKKAVQGDINFRIKAATGWEVGLEWTMDNTIEVVTFYRGRRQDLPSRRPAVISFIVLKDRALVNKTVHFTHGVKWDPEEGIPAIVSYNTWGDLVHSFYINGICRRQDISQPAVIRTWPGDILLSREYHDKKGHLHRTVDKGHALEVFFRDGRLRKSKSRYYEEGKLKRPREVKNLLRPKTPPSQQKYTEAHTEHKKAPNGMDIVNRFVEELVNNQDRMLNLPNPYNNRKREPVTR